MEVDDLSWMDIFREKRELFEHLIPSFNYLATTVSLALSSKIETISIDNMLEKMYE